MHRELVGESDDLPSEARFERGKWLYGRYRATPRGKRLTWYVQSTFTETELQSPHFVQLRTAWNQAAPAPVAHVASLIGEKVPGHLGPSSSSFLPYQDSHEHAAAEVQRCFDEATRSVAEGCRGVDHERRLRSLLSSLGTRNGKQSSIRAVEAVLAQHLWPSEYRTDQECWNRHQASKSNFQAWRRKLTKYMRPYDGRIITPVERDSALLCSLAQVPAWASPRPTPPPSPPSSDSGKSDDDNSPDEYRMAYDDVYVIRPSGMQLVKRSQQMCRCGEIVNGTMPICWRHDNPFARQSLMNVQMECLDLATALERTSIATPLAHLSRWQLAGSLRWVTNIGGINDRQVAHYNQLPVVDSSNSLIFARLPARPPIRVLPSEPTALVVNYLSSFRPPDGRPFDATWCVLVLVCHHSLESTIDEEALWAFVALAEIANHDYVPPAL